MLELKDWIGAASGQLFREASEGLGPSGRVVTAKAPGGQASFQGWLEGDEGQQGSCTNRVMEFAARLIVTAMGTGWREQRRGPIGDLGDSGEGGEKLLLLGVSWRSKQIELQDGMQVWETESGMAPSRSDPNPPSFPGHSSGPLPVNSPCHPVRLSLPSPVLLQLQSFCAPVPPSSLHFNSRLCLTHFLTFHAGGRPPPEVPQA